MMKIGRWLIGRALLVILGIVLWESIRPNPPIPYNDLVVPARVIIREEVPPRPPTVIERIRYRYVQSDLSLTAPEGAELQVLNFCRPTVALMQGDTTQQPRTELIRSVTYSTSWAPFQRGSLFVSTATSDFDLLARQYGVRGDFGIGAGDSVFVREPRLGLAKEAVRAVGYTAVLYAAFRLGKAALAAR